MFKTTYTKNMYHVTKNKYFFLTEHFMKHVKIAGNKKYSILQKCIGTIVFTY